jgi:curved DNA-binding protein CbpA
MEDREPSHYEVLGVEPGATKAEVESAYLERRKREGIDPQELLRLERARRILADPDLRRGYDADRRRQEQEQEHGRAPGPRRGQGALDPARGRKQLLVLAGLVAVLGLVMGVVVWPLVAQRVITYAAGTELVGRDGRPYGTVLGYELLHRFPGGVSADAYRLRLSASGSEAWITKEEVNQISRRAR